ncbi:MAG: hypothetical protein WCB11_02245 [Terriglobales bacterium]
MNCIRQQVTKFRMAAFALTMLALLFAAAVRPAQARTLKVDANYETSGAGYKAVTTSDGTGALPHKIALPKGSTSMTFAIDGGSITKGRCTAPCITIDGHNTYNDADGVGNGYSANLLPDESISGIQSPTLGFVTGVFESGPPEGDARATLDFNSIGTDFSSLSPILQQLFFIGDGLTGDGTGSVQVFYVPSGAKTLYLGITDACGGNGLPSCYGDNFGDFIVSYAISTESGAPTLKTFSPAKGKVGASVHIWGYNLLNATAVSFNSVPAKFTVESTLIDAVVPTGATSGVIEVTTPNGTASSKTLFTVGD